MVSRAVQGVGGVFQPIFFARSAFGGPFRADRSGQGRRRRRADLRTSGHQGGPGRGAGKVPHRTASPKRVSAAAGPATPWRETVAATVAGLGFELVEIERIPAGTLRVFIDRAPGRNYPGGPGAFVTVDDCEQVTRQLQYALEVDDVAYSRLEVSSPGLDRPLHREADYERFAGQAVSLTLKLPFQGRKVWKGVLGRTDDGSGWQLVLGLQAARPGRAGRKAAPAPAEPQVLGFTLDEVREARLVPVVDFKGRRDGAGPSAADEPAPEARQGHDRPGPAAQAGETER